MNSTARLLMLALCSALAACARQSLPEASPLSPDRAAVRTEAASHYNVVYTFRGGTDGNGPTGDLIEVHGTLFGTTSSGGSSANLGTVFSVTPSGSEHVVYRFAGGDAGNTPAAGLAYVHRTLYGVTSVQPFALAPSGESYRAFAVASFPAVEGPLASAGGRLYGVARFGGLDGKGCTDRCGSVFVMTESGAQQTLYNFRGGSDGGEPAAGLVAVKGALYGTTLYGGTHNAGTVFEITKAGKHRVLFSFNPKTDGAQPVGKLYAAGGILYGTTEYQGKNDGGTMFAVTLGGHGTIMHQFGASGDASNPTGSLVELKGVFYGTSTNGGTHNTGTVFSVDRAGTERVLYSFNGTPSVVRGLINVHGTLYGSTARGGKPTAGTIFKIQP